MPRPTQDAMSPADLERVGRTLFGSTWKNAMAGALDTSLNAVQQWASGRRGIGPGIRAELARLLAGAPDRIRAEADELEALARRRRADADACPALAAELAGTVGNLHGLTRRELALLGWLLSHRPLMDGDGWLAQYAEPAKTLWSIVMRELPSSSAQLADGEAERLDVALARLTDPQALEVAAAARDVDDLTTGVPDD